MFEADVTFGNTKVQCYVAELEHINGKPLADYLEPETNLSTTAAAQIAVDLFKIRDELQKKNVNHNDLHPENIILESLGMDARRAGAIDDSIRAVAIDLGSVSEGSKSDSEELRLGDLHWIALYLNKIVRKLLRDPDHISDLENRLASALQLIAQSISPIPENQRTPTATDFIQQIEEASYRATQHWRPWRESLTLKTFSDSYNAQTMNAWHVPQLLVDPEGQWVNSICSQGPQVITGIRGCGKTMLLRALQFHARAAERESETKYKILERLKSDNYVGLFVSAQRLLDRLGEEIETTPAPFARLLVAYGLEAVRATLHLHDLDETSVSKRAHKDIAETIASCIKNSSNITSATSLQDLDRQLSFLLTSLSQSDFDSPLEGHPSTAFPFLAEAIRRCSPIWQNAQVLFLLDDVSTRYLNQTRIEELLSALLFQNPSCAFKLTSEAQTIELGLKSPGQVHSARVGRDLSIFDLGAKVYEKIKKPGKGNGRDFVEEILKQRAKYFAAHPPAAPSELLGDVKLETIAAEIGESSRNSRQRKEIYRGITALAGMCVGDIGDVISLYEQILKNGAEQSYPISPNIQSECFQDFCARRLYDLNRRGGFLKDVAKSFAEASYELLIKSLKSPKPINGKRRIRQYSSLYVRITTGDLEKQTERLRELIDAGVFVFAGGSNVPRTKTRDSNPTQQFKLTYRKIYGLVNFIGLADRDRYELSGKDLEEWLNEPSKGKSILLRNLARGDLEDESNEEAESPTTEEMKTLVNSKNKQIVEQFTLFKTENKVPTLELEEPSLTHPKDTKFIEGKKPIIKKFEGQLPNISIDWAIIGLGFEERTLESTRRLCALVNPCDAKVVEYKELGNSIEIKSILTESVGHYSTIQYESIIEHGLPDLDGNVLIDITGLAKPAIFHAVRNELRRKRRVWICHTEAQYYYPLNTDLEKIFQVDQLDRHAQLEQLCEVLTGEKGPYASAKLLSSDSDDSRQRILCAFSSPKHERLLSLLDSRDYDRLEIVAPSNDSNRSKVAKIVADIAARNIPNSNVTEIDSNDIDYVLAFVTEKYKLWYVDRGLNFEFGLTGSKLQAVACAAASASYKISQCWYLQPREFDPDRFTQGVGKTNFYEISLQED